MTSFLLLGYVFPVTRTDGPVSLEGVRAEPTRGKRPTSRGWFTREEYGALRCGEVEARRDGLYLRDDLANSGWVKVGDAPRNFDARGANNGNPVISHSVEAGENWATVFMESSEGDKVVVRVNQNSGAHIDYERSDLYDDNEVHYFMSVASKLYGASNTDLWGV